MTGWYARCLANWKPGAARGPPRRCGYTRGLDIGYATFVTARWRPAHAQQGCFLNHDVDRNRRPTAHIRVVSDRSLPPGTSVLRLQLPPSWNRFLGDKDQAMATSVQQGRDDFRAFRWPVEGNPGASIIVRCS